MAHKTRNACVNIVCIARWQHVTAKFAGCTQRVHTVAVCKWRVAGPGRRSIYSLSGFILSIPNGFTHFYFVHMTRAIEFIRRTILSYTIPVVLDSFP